MMIPYIETEDNGLVQHEWEFNVRANLDISVFRYKLKKRNTTRSKFREVATWEAWLTPKPFVLPPIPEGALVDLKSTIIDMLEHSICALINEHGTEENSHVNN
ncbi:hypothetical protein [Paenibacillus illinoisensis]|uniref:hypothetical protein n=1 Tax=Paenibacillus illinoisensis TaxID=59845 RepID=UPI00203F3A0C|nr:hypothetical protein [Paenibacillus illinoisensis]MCM3208514.1 hypothetical protein [Paenibacillus illinoisensis]